MMEDYRTRSALGLREIMAAMAAALAHVIISESYGHLSWQSLLGTMLSFLLVWGFFDWAIGRWMYYRDRAQALKEAQKYSIEGSWGSLLIPTGKKEPTGISILNIHSNSKQLSVSGQSFKIEFETDGRAKCDQSGNVLLSVGGDWHSKKAAFSGDSLLYEYASYQEQASGMCIYTFTWKDSNLPPQGYNGAFYDLGGEGQIVRGIRLGGPMDLSEHGQTKRLAERTFAFLSAGFGPAQKS